MRARGKDGIEPGWWLARQQTVPHRQFLPPRLKGVQCRTEGTRAPRTNRFGPRLRALFFLFFLYFPLARPAEKLSVGRTGARGGCRRGGNMIRSRLDRRRRRHRSADDLAHGKTPR